MRKLVLNCIDCFFLCIWCSSADVSALCLSQQVVRSYHTHFREATRSSAISLSPASVDVVEGAQILECAKQNAVSWIGLDVLGWPGRSAWLGMSVVSNKWSKFSVRSDGMGVSSMSSILWCGGVHLSVLWQTSFPTSFQNPFRGEIAVTRAVVKIGNVVFPTWGWEVSCAVVQSGHGELKEQEVSIWWFGTRRATIAMMDNEAFQARKRKMALYRLY